MNFQMFQLVLEKAEKPEIKSLQLEKSPHSNNESINKHKK